MVVFLILFIFCILKLSVTKIKLRRNFSLVFDFIRLGWLRIAKSEDMNKVIDTSTRVFMAIVGPSGSGKTELIFKILMGNTFYPKFGTILYLYKNIQPAVSEKVSSHEVNVKFMKFNGFESLRNLEIVLLVFDDSCEDIYNDKEFVRLATAGRHRGIDVIYVRITCFNKVDGRVRLI